MTESYPWGAQAPQARLTKLQGNLRASETAREKYLEGHKVKLASFDEADRQIRAEIKQCQQILDRERSEATADAMAKLLMKVIGNRNPEALEEALKNGVLEQELAAVAGKLDVKEPKPRKQKANAADASSTPAGASV